MSEGRTAELRELRAIRKLLLAVLAVLASEQGDDKTIAEAMKAAILVDKHADGEDVREGASFHE